MRLVNVQAEEIDTHRVMLRRGWRFVCEIPHKEVAETLWRAYVKLLHGEVMMVIIRFVTDGVTWSYITEYRGPPEAAAQYKGNTKMRPIARECGRVYLEQRRRA